MGVFGRDRRSREEKAEQVMNQVASGKGFYGRATRAFVGSEDLAAMQQSIGTYKSGAYVSQLLAAGAPTVVAVVVSISDTGKLINFDPVVNLVVQLTGGLGGQVALQTLVSKLQIPRTGDQVLLLADPAQPGAYLYAGMA